MKTTREKVLLSIKNRPKSTINDIADDVGINAISVRHHLTNLQVGDLINAEEERHGVGRPRLVYSLTEKGHEKFPSRYFHLLKSLMNQIKDTIPEKDVHAIFNKMADDLTSEYKSLLNDLSIDERLNLLKDILSNEGFDIDWEKTEEGYRIKEKTCPFHQMGDSHPEVCLFDKAIISNILMVSPNKIIRTKHEKNLCTYTFQP